MLSIAWWCLRTDAIVLSPTAVTREVVAEVALWQARSLLTTSGCNLKEICEYAGPMNATLFPADVGQVAS